MRLVFFGIVYLLYFVDIPISDKFTWVRYLILLSMTYLAAASISDILSAARLVDFDKKVFYYHFAGLVIFTFVALIMAFALMYKIYVLRDTSNQAVVHDPEICLYFSVMTLTTVGYGDFVPSDYMTRTLAGLQAVSGFLILAGLVSFFQLVFLRSPGGNKSSG